MKNYKKCRKIIKNVEKLGKKQSKMSKNHLKCRKTRKKLSNIKKNQKC